MFLTSAGKEVLIKSVVTAIPAYPMAVFKFTDGLCKEIDSEIAKFWWGEAGNGGKKIHWLGWEKLGLPKVQGGLGFRCLKDYNLALLAKLSWRILQNPSALWVQVLKGLYFPNCDFLLAKKGSGASWAWSSILDGHVAFSKHHYWQFLNGESILTWRDKWIPGIPGGKPLVQQLYGEDSAPYQSFS